MSSISGYDALYGHFTPDIEIESVFCNFKKMYPRGVGRLLEKSSRLVGGSGFYNAQSFESEIRLFLKARRKKHDIVHYCYGESYLGFGAILTSRLKLPLVVTHHQPVSWWAQNSALAHKYKNVNTVITLSEYDKNYFEDLVPGRVVCIPHGVDIDFYKPETSLKKESGPFKILFVGRYLRDTLTLSQAVKKLLSFPADIYFDIVYSDKAGYLPAEMRELSTLSKVKWHSEIGDQNLLALYRQADCCLIPLNDCTANNAILEAMACGVPVITTNLPAAHTYLDDTMSIMCRQKNSDDLVEAVLLLYNDISARVVMGERARKKAEQYFDWNIIASKTITLFNDCNE
ncbi:Glycosyltransferase involved in cell wall bisynthesis [Mucilaginibacter pineti]|uniref:Glycosyltransferase involved in cell wall bisynthesis n=2 Tax=Mucilaginibacter pineti TaxID=1391627 RepID=A0A1G6ZN50_9SPHI|nr:Glycosyltransferase involved in cell wall bisynthesis [Mucilaginibacter pineti]